MMSAPEPGLEIQAAARLLAEGRATEAARTLEPLVDAAPAYAAALVLLARAYETEGRRPEALAVWHRAHFLVPTSPLVRRERQRLLDAGVEAPIPPASVPEQKASPESSSEAQEGVHTGPGDSSIVDSPLDAVWSDEGDLDDAGVHGTSVAGDSRGTPDAGPANESAFNEPDTLPIDWMVDADAGRRAGAAPPDPIDGEPARLFSEDAFSSEESFTGSTTFDGESEGASIEDEGWALLDETDDRVPEQQTTPSEAEVAPPPGHAPPTYWRVEPTSESLRRKRPPMAEEDLDSLIQQIEDAPRIKPDPHFIPPATFEVEPAVRDDDDVVSETLAQIYATQGQFGEAASVYEKLALQRPADAETFRQRATEMRERAGGSQG